jgi:hypothetical protein
MNSWKLMFLFAWDAIFHRGPDPHMQRAMELSNDKPTPPLRDKREDELYRGKMWD